MEQECEKCSKTFFKVLERQNLKNQTLFEVYTGNNKSKYSGNPKAILKSQKKNCETLYPKEKNSKAATTDILSKIPNKKISNEQCNIFEAKYL